MTFAADPMNPTDAELSAAIERGLENGTLIDSADWMAREAEADVLAEKAQNWIEEQHELDVYTELDLDGELEL